MSIQHSSSNVDQSSSILNLRDYALALHGMGFNVLPIQVGSKAASIEWKAYQKCPQTTKEIANFNWQENIAIIDGPNGIRTIDLDACTNYDLLFHILTLLGLEHDYPWVTHTPGKGGGFHIHLICHEPLTLTPNGVLVGLPINPLASFKQLELRWNSCYCLLPPSFHPDTQTHYVWAFGEPSTPLATVPVQLVERMFSCLADPQKELPHKEVNTTAPTSKITKEPKTPQKKILRYDAWANKALTQELALLQNTLEGKRNEQLNKSAFNLGQIIGAGLLNQDMVEQELTRTAELIGLPLPEIQATLTSGITQGLKQPRMPRQIFEENEPPIKLAPLHDPKSQDFDNKLTSFSADDQGNAEAVYYLFGKYITYNDASGWTTWNTTHFTPSIQRINTLIVETLRLRASAARHMERKDIAEISKSMAGRIAACRTLLETLAYVEIEKFDNEPDLINTKSGIVHLRTKKIIPHDPSYRFTWCTSVGYNPNANSNPWLDFLNETVESLEMVGYLKQSLGYSITGHTNEESMFYIYGPPRSGKGTMCEIILSIFPRPIATEVDFNSFTAKRENDSQNFDLAPLKAARIVFASESNKYQSLNPAKIKQLTGGNLVHCAFKHRDFFTYRPQYVVWLSSNHEVNGDPDDDALWGRIKVIIFPNSKLGSEDKSLKYRMQSPEILEGVLAWLIDGAAEWYELEGKGLETPEAVKQLTQQQRSAQDSVGLWLEECCEFKADEWTESSRVRASYEMWCETNGYEAKKAKGLGQSLTAHGYEVSVAKWVITTPNSKGKSLRGVRNLIIL